jgi:hypothetical protein
MGYCLRIRFHYVIRSCQALSIVSHRACEQAAAAQTGSTAPCSGPQGIDNLHHVAARGIIADGSAATTVSTDRKIPTWQPGRMDGRRPCNLQHPMLGRQVRSTDGRCPVGRPAPRHALVDDRSTPRLQGMWHFRFRAHRAQLA